MRQLYPLISTLCVLALCAITVITGVDSGSFRNTFKYHYDADRIPCDDFGNKLVLEFPSTYPELKPLQQQILSSAKKRGYISLAEERLMHDAVRQVQEEETRHNEKWAEKKALDAAKKAYGLK